MVILKRLCMHREYAVITRTAMAPDVYAVELWNVGNLNFKLQLFRKTLIALFTLFKVHKNKLNKAKKAILLIYHI